MQHGNQCGVVRVRDVGDEGAEQSAVEGAFPGAVTVPNKFTTFTCSVKSTVSCALESAVEDTFEGAVTDPDDFSALTCSVENAFTCAVQSAV